LGHL
jgi:hypothetical protein